MANKLSKVTMAFGGATSPTAVTSQHIESLLKVIADVNVENHFSGHISLATGSISAVKEYTLGAAGITYHGTVTPIAYTISASSSTVEEGSRVTFNVNSEEKLPLGAFRFVVKSVAVTSGSITSDEVKALCKFTNNVMSVDVSGKNERWQATITVESSLIFDPNNRHTASVTAKGLMLATDFTVTGDSAVSIINGTPVTKNYTFSWLPTGGDAPSDIQVTCDSDNVTIGSIQKTGFQVVFNGTESYAATIKVTTLGKIKEVPIVVTHKRVPTISIIGADSVKAINGSAKAEYQFGFNPSDYDVDVQLLSVVSNQSGKVSVKTGYSMAGFTLDITITEDVTATITAQFNVDGETKTVTKVISALYEEKEVDPPPYDKETLDTLGVAIMDVDGNLYASVSEWEASGKDKDTELLGIAFSNATVRFVVPRRKQRTRSYWSTSNPSPNKIYPDYVNATGLPYFRTTYTTILTESEISRMGMTDYKSVTSYLKHNIVTNYGSNSTADALFELAEAARTIRTNTGAYCYIANTFIMEIVRNKLQGTSDAVNMVKLLSMYGCFACGIDVYYSSNEQSGGFVVLQLRTDNEIGNEKLGLSSSSGYGTLAFLIYPL